MDMETAQAINLEWIEQQRGEVATMRNRLQMHGRYPCREIGESGEWFVRCIRIRSDNQVCAVLDHRRRDEVREVPAGVFNSRWTFVI